MVIEINNKQKKYKKSDHMVYSCQYHVIFCTKYRRPVLVGKIVCRLKDLIIRKAEEIEIEILEMEVMPDHVHLLLDVSPIIGIHKTISLLKGCTSNKLRNEFPELKKRLPSLWTHSKFISTVGSVSLNIVKDYIKDQKNK